MTGKQYIVTDDVWKKMKLQRKSSSYDIMNEAQHIMPQSNVIVPEKITEFKIKSVNEEKVRKPRKAK